MLGGESLERNSLHIFHHEIGQALLSNSAAIKPGNVRMVERRENALFLPEMPDELFSPETLLNQFDRYLTAKMRIVSQINFAHAAFAEQRNDSVVTEHLAGGKLATRNILAQQLRSELNGRLRH